MNTKMWHASLAQFKLLLSNQSVRATKLFYSLIDQVFSTGAVFLANVVLARAGTMAEYGAFTLTYSIFTFLSGIHNALLLEPYSVFSSGKYRNRFPDYVQLILRSNLIIGLSLSGLIFFLAGILFLLKPEWFSSTMLGLAGSILFLLTGGVFRRIYYAKFDSKSAAHMSVIFFTVVCLGLTGFYYYGKITGLTVFLVLSLGWIVVSPMFLRTYPMGSGSQHFLIDHQDYWVEHWRYSRWVLATALVFQAINQGYYWIVGGLLTVEDVARLKAVQNVVLPMNLIFNSFSLLVLPRMSMTFQQKSVNGLQIIVWKVIMLLLTVAVTFFIWILLFGKEILDLMYSGKYTSSAHLLYIIGLTPIPLMVGNIFNDALKAMEQPKWVFYAYVGGGGVTIALGIPMVHGLGLVGAVWGILASSVAYGLMLFGGFYWGCQVNAMRNVEVAPEVQADR